jgi:hypothetical protein
VNKDNKKLKDKEYYIANKEEFAIYNKAYYQEHKEEIKNSLKEIRLIDNSASKESSKKYYEKNKELISKKAFEKRAALRKEKNPSWNGMMRRRQTKNGINSKNIRVNIIRLLGNKCCVCGFEDIRALQIDHINGGGNREIKKMGQLKMYWYIYELIGSEKENNEYQILCANCNWIKKSENKEYGMYKSMVQ